MFLKFLYNTAFGRVLLKLLTRPGLSTLCGKFLDSSLSKFLNKGFIERNNIDISQLEETEFTCFNDCFARKLRPEFRPIDGDENSMISPCDGLLSAYEIKKGLVVPVKGSRYSIEDLLGKRELAKRYDGGLCLVFRLSTSHYHRYCYAASGIKSDNTFIPGILHTVQPIALREVPVFVENSREYTVISTEIFGDVVQMEVGALLVGKIQNYHGSGAIKKGMEKGRFLYGGSTIILLIEKDKLKLTKDYIQSTMLEKETFVVYGEKIGERI